MIKNEKRIKSHPTRWSEGRTHRLIYDEANDEWYIPCRGLRPPPRGTVIDDPSVVVDCKHCPGAG